MWTDNAEQSPLCKQAGQTEIGVKIGYTTIGPQPPLPLPDNVGDDSDAETTWPCRPGKWMRGSERNRACSHAQMMERVGGRVLRERMMPCYIRPSIHPPNPSNTDQPADQAAGTPLWEEGGRVHGSRAGKALVAGAGTVRRSINPAVNLIRQSIKQSNPGFGRSRNQALKLTSGC